jgi:hypothetical protein
MLDFISFKAKFCLTLFFLRGRHFLHLFNSEEELKIFKINRKKSLLNFFSNLNNCEGGKTV